MKSRSKRVFLRAPEADDCDSLISLYRSSRQHFHGFADSSYTRGRAAIREHGNQGDNPFEAPADKVEEDALKYFTDNAKKICK